MTQGNNQDAPIFDCASCKAQPCNRGGQRKDDLCPCNEEALQHRASECYLEEGNFAPARNAALVESEGYCRKTRLEEIMDYAGKCGYRKLGLAFCTGLRREAGVLADILEKNGFVVSSAVCKNGHIPKEHLALMDSDKVHPGGFEAMCNPIGQALLLNQSKTQLNLVLGLCVGHDSLFFKYSQAPVTVFAVKDRVLAHNPLAAVYLSESYYKDRLYPGK